jgi:chorismate-pyruvate lyase
VVQYGIVRLQLNALNEAPRREILSEKIPLGRVLVEHGVLRQVELVDLWKIVVGPKLAKLLQVEIGSITFGRTAMIYFSNHPALELLEIVI